jgi:hypothetical protein
VTVRVDTFVVFPRLIPFPFLIPIPYYPTNITTNATTTNTTTALLYTITTD